jgi:outer membrane lipoprotein SlyB
MEVRMWQHRKNAKTMTRGLLVALAAAALLAVAGCANNPTYRNGGTTYGTTYGNNTNNAQSACNQCGTVQSVRKVDISGNNSHHVLGTVIGAVAGGLIGNQVGGGKGKTAATAAGAVAGGAVGHQVAKNRSSEGYQVVIKLDDGQTATVTQKENPKVQIGDRVEIRNDHVYEL